MLHCKGKRALSLLLVLAMMFSTLSVTAFATETETTDSSAAEEITEVINDIDADESTEGSEDVANTISSTEDDTADGEEAPVADDSVDDTEEEQTDDGDSESELSVSDWDTFIGDLKVLEGYADSYVASNPDDNTIALVINYIRTGVERYLSDSWETIAGAENTAFVTYVAEQDEANSTSASALRNLENFTIANGDTMDFGHLFGCLNVASNNSYNQNYVDFGSWLGDICDLLDCANCYGVEATTVEEMVTEITETYFLDNYLSHLTEDGVTSGFSYTDFRADMDCFYIVAQISSGASSLSSIFESYYTSDLTDASRAAYFLNNRFGGSTTQETVRTSIYDTYSAHVLAQLLEADRDLTDVDDLRTACCYVLADYLYALADGLLDETEDPEEPGDDDTDDGDNAYYSVFSSSTTTLAPGVTQEINYALTADDKQIVYYVATVDTSRDDVAIYANYNDNDPSEGWAMSSVTSQMTAAEERHSDSSNEDTYIENYSAVVGVNGDFYNMSTGQPSGALVMEGVTYQSAKSENFFAILDDGTAVIGTSSEWDTYADRVQEAVGGSTILVKDGEIAVSTSSSYYTSRASRTCVGITADGQVVLMVLDGRQEPFSAGGSAEEIAQIMIDAGCVIAMNLDGGGSTTYAAKQEGSDEISVVNRPSDGYERNVSSSLVVVSTAYTSTEFDHALLTTDTDYLTIGSTLDVTITGVSSTGNAAEIPEGAYLQVSDESIGSIDGNTFTALARGTVDIQLVVDGEVVGSKTLTVIRRPDTLTFTKSSINAIYGVAEELPLEATYENNPVTINTDDITFTFSTSTAGMMDGFSFIGDESSGVRKVTITAAVTTNLTIEASMVVNLYSSEESIFDFDNAMYGDESLAWNRDVSNAITLDNTTYYIIDTEQDTTASYTFAIDIQAIEAPERLAPLMTYLAGFAGTSGDATPWDYLLALAARVNTQTNVTISVEIAEGVDVDISELSVVNDYFKLTSAEYDEETRILTVICNWVKQDGAIDPDTANSICVLSGITLTPSDDAVVDSNNCVTVSMSGTVSYDIYLRSSQLYSLASSTSNQEAYGIYPYYDPDDSAGYYGGHFSDEYTTFVDTFYVKQEALNGWVSVDDQLYYYVDNEYVTGVQYVPGYDDEGTSCYYSFGDSGICQGKVTGLFEYNNALYYAVSGVLKTGWRVIVDTDGESQYYYFDETTYGAVDGQVTIDGLTYTFDNYVLVKGAWKVDEQGTQYYWAGSPVARKWCQIDGSTYYFDYFGYMVTGLVAVERGNSNNGADYYLFGEDGALITDAGLVFIDDDIVFIDENGMAIYAGLVQDSEGNYYYINSTLRAVKNCEYYITKTNGLMASGIYEFDEDGKLILSTNKNGIVEENDSLYYYVDGVLTYAGLIEIDGSYYYVRSSGEVVHGCNYYVTKTNDLLPAGTYEFEDDGKMVIPETKNGIIEENGSLYYYVDGVLTYAGLIEIDGSYYYVRSSGEVVYGCSYYVTKTNDLLPTGTYEFEDDGKMVIPETKNGIIEENGSLYYYVDGVLTYVGLIEIDGSYYYVKSSCEVVHTCSYYVTKTNDLLPAGTYEFGDDGKMVVPEAKDGIIEENDSLYYYVDGVLTYAGLIEIDGSYYYVKSSGEVVNNCQYYVYTTNGLMDAGTYYFGSDGKMILEEGLAFVGGEVYYLDENGQPVYAGLVQDEDGNYYYINSSLTAVKDCEYYITKTNGLMDVGTYQFDENGMMVIN